MSVIEQQPKDSDEAGRLAGNYLQARSMSIAWRERRTPVPATVPATKCPRCGRHGHWACDCAKPRYGNHGQQAAGDQSTTPPKGSRPQTRDSTVVRCYNCNHYSSNCPKKALYCGRPEGDDNRARRRGTVNGVYCTDILVDTGATHTMVRKDLVAGDDMLDGEVTIRCVHGDTTSYPLAVVKINIGGKDIITTAAVSSTLPASILLGWDVPELVDFIADGQSTRNKADALAVMTRLRRRQQEVGNRDSSAADTEASPDVKRTEAHYVFNFDDSLFTPAGPTRPTLTRAQKRENRRRYRYFTDNAGHG